MYHGILNVYKEKGFTSHDVVAKLRGILGQKKIGHTGTLDPDAEGVLPVCLGKGTKLCDLLTDQKKTYEAVLLLGVTTDTQDATGQVLARKEPDISESDLEKRILSFTGTYDQIPPMYSAIKQKGKKLYELARAGITVERKARKVTIYRIDILEMNMPRVRFAVECAKGTYIRALCEDIGNAAGCGGCMESLVRTRVGDFCLKDSLTLSRIETLAGTGALKEFIAPPDSFFTDCPPVYAAEEQDRALHNGNSIRAEQTAEGKIFPGRVRMYDTAGVFAGLYEYDPQMAQYRPVKMFLERDQSL